MGTRCFVGVMNGDSCTTIYVHTDGNLSGVGQELQDYKDQVDVEYLIFRGDRETLDTGFFYHGDESQAKVYSSFDDLLKACENYWAEWYYIFKDGIWYCGNMYSGSNLCKKLVPYTEAIKMYEDD